jgi:hypothetical protein
VSALLTKGFPSGPAFVDPSRRQGNHPAPAPTAHQPFGYRFRTFPTGITREHLSNLRYNPATQIATYTSNIPKASGGGPTTRTVTTYFETFVDDGFVIDPLVDYISD